MLFGDNCYKKLSSFVKFQILRMGYDILCSNNLPRSAFGARVRDVLFQHFDAHLALHSGLLPVQMYFHHVTGNGGVTCLVVLVLHYVLEEEEEVIGGGYTL